MINIKSVLFLSLVIPTFYLFCFNESGLCMGCSQTQNPTVTVVDAETNAPIEGAVAIAIWRKTSYTKRAFWEGGTEIPVRIEEAVSDKEGKITIDDFWDWHFSKDSYPHLTIYKPGYVCWDQEYIFNSGGKKRKGFDNDHRTVKMEKWKEGYSYMKHETFVHSVTQNETREAKEGLFQKAFNYERPFIIREWDEQDKKMLEKREGRDQK